jgi:antitoxin component YwqK of YwqJK toxin-antitoxin module
MKYKLIVGALIIVTAQASSVWAQSPRDLSSLFLNGDIYLTHEDGQPYSGSVVVTDPNRGTKEFGTLRDGLRHGGFEWFFENNQLGFLDTYRDGQRHGPFEYYYKNGFLLEKGTMRNGRRHGLSEEYAFRLYRLTHRGNYDLGYKCGSWIEHGESRSYDPCPTD